MDDKIEKLRHEIRVMQVSLENKNKQLSMLNNVWCTGGCESGFVNKEMLSEEMVSKAEQYAKRLRTYFENYKNRNQ